MSQKIGELSERIIPQARTVFQQYSAAASTGEEQDFGGTGASTSDLFYGSVTDDENTGIRNAG
ncbi:MAG: hypothetical protein MZV70_30720 [Desulfobacterales bacterium]|nr:hypothetical protein [Desulfobacterales bacterium]